MSAKEKHTVRKVRQIIRNIFINAKKKKTMDEENIDDEEEALRLVEERIKDHQARNKKQNSKDMSTDNLLQKIYSRLLRTVENDDLTTAKMSKAISNLDFFGLDDSYFILPKNKRSAPTPVKTSYYFYQRDYRKMHPDKKITKKLLEANWKKLTPERKEYFVRLHEQDMIRYKFQMLQHNRMQSKN